MTTLARIHTAQKVQRTSGAYVARSSMSGRFMAKHVVVTAEALDESFEDAQLGAIADERANGPFVKVTLDDL